MQTVVAAIVIIGLLMLAMAIGVIFKREPLKGSCGGSELDCLCDRLGKPRQCELKKAIADAKAAHASRAESHS